MIIGLTGSIASGKSTVSLYLKNLGYNVIDCDQISHEVLNTKAYSQILELFSSDILTNNVIDRAKLGAIVFNNEELLKKLNNILHPLIKEEVLKNVTEFCFIDCPLLFETDYINLVDKSLVIYTTKDVQLKRLMNRDSLSEEDALKRINLQMSLEEKKKLANYVINNNNSKEVLYNEIKNFLLEVNNYVYES